MRDGNAPVAPPYQMQWPREYSNNCYTCSAVGPLIDVPASVIGFCFSTHSVHSRGFDIDCYMQTVPADDAMYDSMGLARILL